MKTQLNEIKRMQQLAGILTESQLNELSPETLRQAAVAADTKGRNVQADKFRNAAQKIYKFRRDDKIRQDYENNEQKRKQAIGEAVKFEGKKFKFFFPEDEKNYYELLEIKKILPLENDNYLINIGSSSNIFSFKYNKEEDNYEFNNFRSYPLEAIDRNFANTLLNIAKIFNPESNLKIDDLMKPPKMNRDLGIAGYNYNAENATEY